MKRKLMTLACAFPLIAADPQGFVVWTSAELDGMSQKLDAKAAGAKFASDQLAKYGNHLTMVARRTGNGQAELHETDADLFVVHSGSANLVVGGKIPDAKTSAPHEIRGSRIEGGTKRALGPGDIVHIPARTPHQLMIEDGKEFFYFTMKIGGQ